MDNHVEISVELESNMDSPSRWKERCLARVKNLKNQFHPVHVACSDDSNDRDHDDDDDDEFDDDDDDDEFDDDSDDKLSSFDQSDKETSPEELMMSREMYEAARDGAVDAFVDVLEAECGKNNRPLYNIVYHTTPGGDTVLHVAAKFGRDNIVEVIAPHYPEFLIWQNNKGDTPLHVAARVKSTTTQVMKVILFEYGLGLSENETKITRIRNRFGNTPLHEAVLSKHFDGVSLLLSLDPDVAHDMNEFDKSLLYLAAEVGDVKILRLLLQTPFSSQDPCPKYSGKSPLYAAILCRNPAMLKEIVNMRPDLMDLRHEDGGSALHFAAQTGYVEGVRILLKISTLEAFKFNTNMDSPIHIACEMGHLDVVKELLHQIWPHPKILLNKNGQNILHIAAQRGKNNVVKYLLKNPKIDTSMVNERDNYGNTPLHLASRNLCLWTVLALSQDKRVNVNSTNTSGFTARDIVCMNSSTPRSRVEFLCEVILRRVDVPLIKANMFDDAKLSKRNPDWNVKEAANTLLLVGILIATLTFTAGFTIPGGVYGSDEADPRKRGMAVLAHETLFKIFMVLNLVAMYSSTLGSVILLWVQMGDPRFALGLYELARPFVYLALTTMSVAFLAALRLVVSNNHLLADVVTVIGLIFLFFILFILTLGRFPLGTRLPLFRNVGELFIRIILVLFYGRHDVSRLVPRGEAISFYHKGQLKK